MDVYFSPLACSLASRITLYESGQEATFQRVDTKAGKTASGEDYRKINPKGLVPALRTDDGVVLTENAAILQYVADLKPESRVAPTNGTLARTRLQEALHYIGTEIHRGYSPLFRSNTPAEVRAERVAHLRKHYGLLDRQLKDRPYLLGNDFTVADAYLFAVTRWAQMVNVDLSDFTHVQSFQQRVAARPAVQAAMRAQGLLAAA